VKVLTRREESRQIEARIALILRAGVVAAAALLTVSLPWVVVQDGSRQSSTLSVGEALRRLPALDPRGLAALGVLVLVATPILQLLASAFLFWRKRDRLYLGFTLLVCLIIATGVLFAAA
jgi:uncharacterized membrane protein